MTQQEILRHLGIDALNAMQQETISAARRSRRLVLLSPTGSGKTLAYLLPLVGELQREALPALVLVPSRELAVQTVEVVRAMKCGVRAVACYGGRPAMDEHRVLREVLPQIVVATPGRAADHLCKLNIDGAAIRTLVIDEFDKSLELGFHEEMAEVMAMLPNLDRRFLLSATDSDQIPSFVGADFRKLDFTDQASASPEAEGRLTIHLLRSPEKDKLHTLRSLLCHIGAEPSMVFVNYRESVERVATYLKNEGFSVSAFHGGMEQRDRERALNRFAGGAALTLVSTDLAARGLDIDNVRHVIHYHLPLNQGAFTHRNGRTARWDREGEAWVIVGPTEIGQLDNLQLNHLQLDHLQLDNGALQGNGEADIARFPGNQLSNGKLSNCQIPSPLWATLYFGKGKKDKINKVDIVGFLSKVCGLQREELGRIDVGDHWAYAAVARERADEVLLRARGQKIKGVKTIIEKAR